MHFLNHLQFIWDTQNGKCPIAVISIYYIIIKNFETYFWFTFLLLFVWKLEKPSDIRSASFHFAGKAIQIILDTDLGTQLLA